jgi:hypothetical protein
MADNIRRYFWIVPGKTDKDGRPIEYDQAPTYVPVLGTKPVQILEEMTPDGEYIQYKHNPDSGQWEEFTRGVDKARLDLSNARKRDEPKKQTPDEARLDKANADLAEANANKAKNPPKSVVNTDANEPNIVYSDGTTAPNPNYRKPPMITRTEPTPGTNSALDDPRSMTTDTVSKEQADYDRQTALDRQARAEAAQKQAYDNAMLAIARDKMTAEQARDQYQKDLDKIRLDLQKEQHADTMAATKRSQDITLRGQDLDAGVSQRNADLSASTQLASEGARISMALLPYWNAPGQIESTNSLMAGGPPVPTQPVSKPPVSPTLPLELAAAAQAQMPSRFTMPGTPPASGPYTMPMA